MRIGESRINRYRRTGVIVVSERNIYIYIKRVELNGYRDFNAPVVNVGS